MSAQAVNSHSTTRAAAVDSAAPERLGHLIDGDWEPTDATLESTNPANPGQVVALFPEGNGAVVERAVASASAAQPAWARVGALQRGRVLHAAAAEVQRERRTLALLITREEGKPLREAEAEVARAEDILRFHAGQTAAATGEVFEGASAAQQIRTIRVPLGVVGVISPWNFPIAIPAWKIAPALAHGNAVVWKPSSQTPAVAVALARILERAGLPPGTLNLVLGPGAVGRALIEADGIDGISFTGSEEVGHAIAASTAGRIKVQLELGGNSPAIAFEDCDVESAVAAVADGAMGSSGQKCTATRRALIARPILDEFLDGLTTRVGALRLGDPSEAGTDLGPLVSAEARDVVRRDVEAAIAEGGRLLTEAQDLPSVGHFFAPTVLGELPLDGAIIQREIFGPVLSVMAFDDLDEALQLANDTRFGLSAAVFTRDLGVVERILRELEAGLIHVNGPSTGAEAHVPFGGLKASSGPGPREQGTQAREFFTELKTAYIDHPAATG
jgi:alpha-ketoglutaric semialdehyde dehydrogenase